MYDVIIIGAGPAGVSASIYCKRNNLKTLLIYETMGGQVSYTNTIENYPGINNITGLELSNQFLTQIYNLEIETSDGCKVTNIDIKENYFTITNEYNEQFNSKSIILAMGKSWKKLNLNNEDKFLGKGISICTTCDAPLMKNKICAVVGSGNSAAEAALELSEYANEVYIIVRSKNLKAEKILLDKIINSSKIKILYESNITSLNGNDKLESITINENIIIPIYGLFIEIGLIPNISLIKNLPININSNNEIIIDHNNMTNIKGIFSAGDITNTLYKQISIASGEGSKAALSVFNYLRYNS